MLPELVQTVQVLAQPEGERPVLRRAEPDADARRQVDPVLEVDHVALGVVMAHHLGDPVDPVGDLEAVADPARQLVGELHPAEGLVAGGVLAAQHEVADAPVEAAAEAGAVAGEVLLAGGGVDEGVDRERRHVTGVAEQPELRADVEVAQADVAVVQIRRQLAGGESVVVVGDGDRQLPAVGEPIADAAAGLVPEEELLVWKAGLAQHRVPVVVIHAKIPPALRQGIAALQSEEPGFAGVRGSICVLSRPGRGWNQAQQRYRKQHRQQQVFHSHALSSTCIHKNRKVPVILAKL